MRSWREKYHTLAEYYKGEYPDEFFEFEPLELLIDPDETVEQMNEYNQVRQQLEYKRCVQSFPYFAHKYFRIMTPDMGLVPFILYKYQRRAIREFEANRFSIVNKFRQGGFTTLAEAWSTWRCLFKLDQQIMLVSKTDREAVAAGEIVNRAVRELPEWMRPSKEGKWNEHEKQFLETGGKLFFYTPEAARGRSLNYLILDEAAFVENMDKQWKAMFPTLAKGGSCVVISTVNGVGNWYHQTYVEAQEGRSPFKCIDVDYWEHPDYHKDEFVRTTKAILGAKGWAQEVLRSFLDSGDPYIPTGVIAEIENHSKQVPVKRKLFKQWAANTGDEWDTDGALWIWQEPKEGAEYGIGVDASAGVGENNDYSCFQVFNLASLEQVAEFYSNTIPPYTFSQIVNEMGIVYNHALVVVENMGPGIAVLENLQHQLRYDNLYTDPSSKRAKPGIKTSPNVRSVMLEGLKQRLVEKSMQIRSSRFAKELVTFMFNAQSNKAEARTGYHDDAIMAAALLLYGRDTLTRDLPIGAEPQRPVNTLASQMYEEIRQEILKGAPEEFLRSREPVLPREEDLADSVLFEFRRKHDALLREFAF